MLRCSCQNRDSVGNLNMWPAIFCLPWLPAQRESSIFLVRAICHWVSACYEGKRCFFFQYWHLKTYCTFLSWLCSNGRSCTVLLLRPSFKRSYMTFKKFKDICQLPKNAPPSNLDIQELRQEYWRSLPTSEPVYGSDFDGTLTDKTMQIW